MPHFSNIIVEPDGPIINVQIGVSAQRRAALAAANVAIPSHQIARLLIDTGASMTSVDQTILAALQLQPTGSVQMHTPSTGSNSIPVPTFDVELHFTGFAASAHTFSTMGVLGCDFSGQNIDGLFGRDALKQATLFYSGPDDSWTMSF